MERVERLEPGDGIAQARERGEGLGDGRRRRFEGRGSRVHHRLLNRLRALEHVAALAATPRRGIRGGALTAAVAPGAVFGHAGRLGVRADRNTRTARERHRRSEWKEEDQHQKQGEAAGTEHRGEYTQGETLIAAVVARATIAAARRQVGLGYAAMGLQRCSALLLVLAVGVALATPLLASDTCDGSCGNHCGRCASCPLFAELNGPATSIREISAALLAAPEPDSQPDCSSPLDHVPLLRR